MNRALKTSLEDAIDLCKQNDLFVDVVVPSPLRVEFTIPKNVFIGLDEPVKIAYNIIGKGFKVEQNGASAKVTCPVYARRVIILFDIIVAAANAWLSNDVNSVIFGMRTKYSVKSLHPRDIISLIKAINIDVKKEEKFVDLVTMSLFNKAMNASASDPYAIMAESLGMKEGYTLFTKVVKNVSVCSAFLVTN